MTTPALVAKDRDALAEVCKPMVTDLTGVAAPVYRTLSGAEIADHLIESGAVTTLAEALRQLAEDDEVNKVGAAELDLAPDYCHTVDMLRAIADHLEQR